MRILALDRGWGRKAVIITSLLSSLKVLSWQRVNDSSALASLSSNGQLVSLFLFTRFSLSLSLSRCVCFASSKEDQVTSWVFKWKSRVSAGDIKARENCYHDFALKRTLTCAKLADGQMDREWKMQLFDSSRGIARRPFWLTLLLFFFFSWLVWDVTLMESSTIKFAVEVVLVVVLLLGKNLFLSSTPFHFLPT